MPASESQIAEVYRQFGPIVYRRCCRLLANREQAQDATQEIFIKLLRGAHPTPLTPQWVFTMTTHHCLNLRRDATRRGEKLAALLIPDSSAPDSLPERQLSQLVLQRFDGPTQAVAVSVLVDGMDYTEAGAALGLSARTVSRKLDRFLSDARKFLARSAP